MAAKALRWPSRLLVQRRGLASRRFPPHSTSALAARREALDFEVERLRAVSPSPEAVRVAVVGGGRMGEIRCAHVARSASARLAAFVDVDPGVAAAIACRHVGCEAYVSLEDALAAQSVEAVWICAPTPYHLELIEVAARAGAHVAVEKPVASTAAEIRSAYATCREHGVHLACAFQRRSDSAYAAVARAVEAGDIGSLRSVRTTFRDHPAPPPEFLACGGSNPFHDLATHDIDYILSLIKRVVPPCVDHHPDEVWAVGTGSTPELRSAGVFDAATLVLKWQRGDLLNLCATLDVARGSAYGYDQRLEVFGTSGAALAVDNEPAAPFATYDQRGVHRPPHVHSFPQRFDKAFAAELDHFLDCVRGDERPRVTADDAELATIVAEAALQSATRAAVVKLAKPAAADRTLDLFFA